MSSAAICGFIEILKSLCIEWKSLIEECELNQLSKGELLVEKYIALIVILSEVGV
ncbi:MAG: hypothetical protein N3E36_04895 [Sulfolobales archaeon]|nr:hypothetical protein [Sulfolobales archaeon]MCX8199352.1 hypothetical protein [Sulfolobales archaeon]MDW8170334.1 hypothetical protein [Desulfurococcaceae archaeon]